MFIVPTYATSNAEKTVRKVPNKLSDYLSEGWGNKPTPTASKLQERNECKCKTIEEQKSDNISYTKR